MKPATRLTVLAAVCLVAGSAAAQVQIAPKPPAEKVVTDTRFQVNQVLKIAGQEVPTSVDSKATVTTEPPKAGTDGLQRVITRTDKMWIKIQAPGLDLTFDSAKPDDAKSDLPQVQGLIGFFKAMSGAPYTLVLNGKGELTAVEGVDQIVAKAPADAADLVRAEYSLEKLKREVAQEALPLPDKPVNKGDRWQRTEVQDIGAGQTLTLDTFYEYAGTVEKDGKTFDKVNIFVNGVKYAQADGALNGVKVVRSDLQVAGSSGHYLFDRAAGRVTERATNTRITGGMTMDINGMELPATLDLTLDIHTVKK